jgi:UPF0176 protein
MANWDIITHDPRQHDYPVLLFYKYVTIENPAEFAQQHRAWCVQQGLKGRILVASEGINGTVSGTRDAVMAYIELMHGDQRFADMEFKVSAGHQNVFPKMVCKPRKEIVTLGLENDVDPVRDTAPHLSPQEWKSTLESGDPNLVLIDVRNRYESEVGKFEGAICPPIEYFRDLPAELPKYDHLKDKKVLLYCTGGIRCEKAAALFRREGFKEVYQLHGGIARYAEEVGTDHWKGELFVFDKRMTVPLSEEASKNTPGQCAHTGKPSNHVVNCSNLLCHDLFVVDPELLASDSKYGYCPRCLPNIQQSSV